MDACEYREVFSKTMQHFRFHGCPDCFDRNTYVQFLNKKIGEIYDATARRDADLHQKLSNVVIMWECELKAMMDADPDYKNRLVNYNVNVLCYNLDRKCT